MPTRDPDFYDDFVGADGLLEGRTAPVGGQAWDDLVGGRLAIVNNGMTRVSGVPGGAYGRIDLDAAPARVRANISWTTTDDGGIVIINATGEEPQPLEWMIHPVWTTTQCVLTFWQELTAGADHEFAYAAPLALDTVYEVGWDIDGDLITLLMPDGTKERVQDPLVARLRGPVLICQSWNIDAPEQSPRYEDVSAWYGTPRNVGTPTRLTA